MQQPWCCLLYTSDAADERSSVDLGGRRIIKKKKNKEDTELYMHVDQKKIKQQTTTKNKVYLAHGSNEDIDIKM